MLFYKAKAYFINERIAYNSLVRNRRDDDCDDDDDYVEYGDNNKKNMDPLIIQKRINNNRRNRIDMHKSTLRTSLIHEKPGFYLCLYDYDENFLNGVHNPESLRFIHEFFVAADPTKCKNLKESVEKFILNNNYLVLGELENITFNEISLAEFQSGVDDDYTDKKNFEAWSGVSMPNNYSKEFKIEEDFFTPLLTLDDALKQSSRYVHNDNLKMELERIYSSLNSRSYIGNPVHYHIKAGNRNYAWSMIKTLVGALYANNRLTSNKAIFLDTYNGRRRAERFSDSSYEDIESIFKFAAGSTVVTCVNLPVQEGSEASSKLEVLDVLAETMLTNSRYTLSIIVETDSNKKSAQYLLDKVSREARVITIEENSMPYYRAQSTLRMLVRDSDLKEFANDNLYGELPNKDSFAISEVYEFFENWKKKILQKDAFSAYIDCECEYSSDEEVFNSIEEKANNAPRKVLEEMIGLNDVKTIVDNIIDGFIINNSRIAHNLPTMINSRHMFFTGNPGTAKTTVARLLCKILHKDGVIKNGELVECGRSDLVGKYVGNTAPMVRRAFEKAKGGILFIDEAYSLVDHTFGQEAIDTIVQEMDNRRKDTIVIFAGYKEDMEKLLEANSGLRSRIGFHINFPDYSVPELIDIFKLMLKNNEFEADFNMDYVLEKIFKKASAKDDFGNGRFARKLMENVVLNQSRRLVKNHKKNGSFDRTSLVKITKDDFAVDINYLLGIKPEDTTTTTAIGFR